MQLKKLFRLYKNLIIVGVLLLFSILGLLFGVIPLGQNTMTLWGDVRTLSSDVELLKAKSATLQGLDEETLRRDVLILASAVPPDKSLASVLTTIDTVSGQSGVAIANVSLVKPGSIATESAKKLTKDEAKLGTSLLPFSVNGKGSTDEVKAFLTSVVSVRRIFRLRMLDLSFTGALTDVRMDLDAFYLPYPTSVGSISTIANLTDAEQETITKVEALPLASVTAESTVSARVPSGRDDPFTP